MVRRIRLAKKCFIIGFLLLASNTVWAEEQTPVLYESSNLKANNNTTGTSDILMYTGSFTHAIPLPVPPGTNGHQPQLTLAYNSSTGNSWCGQGWDLSFGVIQRSTKNGIPTYETNADGSSKDTFVFSAGGSTHELTSIGDNKYRVKIDSGFMRFDFDDTNNIWIVYDKSGTKYIFDKRVNNSNNSITFSWSLGEIIDTNGNKIKYYYTIDQNQIYPEHIEYTCRDNETLPLRKINFYLENRTDPNINYRAGFDINTTKRLKNIYVNEDDNLVRSYEFSYSTSSDIGCSLLDSAMIATYNGSLPATKFTYNYDNEPVLESMSHWSTTGTDTTFAFYDFNSDGKMDMANRVNDNNGGWYLDVWFSNGRDGFDYQGQWLTTPASGHFYFNDFNGDGYIDAGKEEITEQFGGGSHLVFTVWTSNQGQGFNDPEVWIDRIEPYVELRTYRGDFNGDKKIDYAVEWYQKLEVFLVNNNGNGFNTPESWPLAGGNQNRKSIIADFNGDGKCDVAQRIIANNYSDCKGLHIWFSNGKDGFIDQGNWLDSSIDTYKLYLGDFNGDGLVDVAQYNASDNGSTGNYDLLVYLNTGSGLVLSRTKNIHSSQDSAVRNLFLADFNGDGLVDIAQNTSHGMGDYSMDQWGGLYVWLNTGTDFIGGQESLTNVGTQRRNFQLYDFSGDGKTDVAWYNSETRYETDDEDENGDKILIDCAAGLDVQLTKGPIPNLLSSIINPQGSKTDIMYVPSSIFPNRLLPFVLPVVSQTNIYDTNQVIFGRPTIIKYYSYKDGYFDLKAKEFLGFKEVGVLQSDGVYSLTKFKQDEGQVIETDSNGNSIYVNPYKGKIYAQESYKDGIGGTKLAETIYTYSLNHPQGKSNWHFPYFSQINNYTYNDEVEKHTAVDYIYDGYGNITYDYSWGEVISNQYTPSGDEMSTETQYAYNDTADYYLVGLPTIIQTYDTAKTEVAKTEYTYDADPPVKGNLASKTSGLDTGPKATITMTYDDYGNVITITDANENDTADTGNITITTYDTDYHTFPIAVENALVHISSFTYDPGTGNMLASTDVNDQATTYEYDNFGRLLRVYSSIDIYPDAPSTRYTYYDFESPNKILIETKQQGEAEGDLNDIYYLKTYQFLDGLGRVAQSQTRTSSNWGSTIISDVKIYDSRNLLSKSYSSFFPDHKIYPDWTFGEYYPYFPSVPAINFTKYTYDALNRVIRRDNPDGSYHTVLFRGWEEEKRSSNEDQNNNPYEQVTNYFKDAYGRITEIQEQISGGSYVTKYTYDILGNLTTINNAINETTTINYDCLGRKINMDDPKMGYWEYQYDANSNLTWQKDGKGQENSLTYDRLSRIISKIYLINNINKGQIDYTYDTGSYGLGRLAKVTDLSGSTEFTYDKLGRVISTTKTINGRADSYITTSEYNASGQQTRLTYPDSASIQYGYDTGGRLLKVEDDTTDYVKLMQYDQNKQMIRIDYNNDLSIGYKYDKNNLRLTKLIVGTTYGAGGTGFLWPDPTFILPNCKDLDAFNAFLNTLEEVSK